MHVNNDLLCYETIKMPPQVTVGRLKEASPEGRSRARFIADLWPRLMYDTILRLCQPSHLNSISNFITGWSSQNNVYSIIRHAKVMQMYVWQVATKSFSRCSHDISMSLIYLWLMIDSSTTVTVSLRLHLVEPGIGIVCLYSCCSTSNNSKGSIDLIWQNEPDLRCQLKAVLFRPD